MTGCDRQREDRRETEMAACLQTMYQIYGGEAQCVLGFSDFDKYPRKAIPAVLAFWSTVQLKEEASRRVVGSHYW